MQNVFVDVIDQHLAGLMAGENEAWDACLPAMIRCAESAIRRRFRQFEDGQDSEIKELVDDAIGNFLLKKILKKDEHGNQIRSGRDLRGYLTMTAINLTIDRITKKTGRPRIRNKAEKEKAGAAPAAATTMNSDLEEPFIPKDGDTEDTMPNPYDAVSLRKEAEILMVREVLSQTPSPCKELLTKWMSEEATGETLGRAFGLSATNALNKLKACKEKMRKTLRRMFPKDYPFLEGNL